MKRLAFTLGAGAFCLTLFSPAAAAKHLWQIGKALDSHATRDLQTTSANSVSDKTTNGTAYTADDSTTYSAQSSITGATHLHQSVFWDKQFVIEGGGYIYTVDDLSQKAVGLPIHGFIARAIANRKHGCRVVIGDPIQYAQDKGKMFIIDADGKKCKLDIVRQERIPNRPNGP